MFLCWMISKLAAKTYTSCTSHFEKSACLPQLIWQSWKHKRIQQVLTQPGLILGTEWRKSSLGKSSHLISVMSDYCHPLCIFTNRGQPFETEKNWQPMFSMFGQKVFIYNCLIFEKWAFSRSCWKDQDKPAYGVSRVFPANATRWLALSGGPLFSV